MTFPSEPPRCAYCFGPIHGVPHKLRGRLYHPPEHYPGITRGGCAVMDKALNVESKPVKVHSDQLVIE